MEEYVLYKTVKGSIKLLASLSMICLLMVGSILFVVCVDNSLWWLALLSGAMLLLLISCMFYWVYTFKTPIVRVDSKGIQMSKKSYFIPWESIERIYIGSKRFSAHYAGGGSGSTAKFIAIECNRENTISNINRQIIGASNMLSLVGTSTTNEDALIEIGRLAMMYNPNVKIGD